MRKTLIRKFYSSFLKKTQPETKEYDFWGHETQKLNYDIYRPKYPSFFFEKILALIPLEARQNYLDIATGTGQLLFPLSSHFSNSFGIDKSETQIETTRQKILDLKAKNIQVEALSVEQLLNFKEKKNLPKFDLVTIGEALHWFPDVREVLRMIKEDVLQQGGIFSVIGYRSPVMEYNVVKDSKRKMEGQEFFKKWFEIIEPCFAFDLKALENMYEDYPFKDFFQVIGKEVCVERVPTSVDDFIKYLKTWSAYNFYVDKFAKNEGFVDPMLVLEEQIRNGLKGIEIQEFEEKEKPINVVFQFFIINMKK